MKISWKINDICNYKCSYCFNKNKTKKHINNINMIHKSIEYLEKLKYDSYYFSFFGGEPTLHPQIHDILKRVNGLVNINKIRIITNLSLSVEKLVEYREYDNLEFFVSCHMEYINDRFIEKLLYLNDNFNVKLSILYYPQYRSKCLDFIDFVESMNFGNRSKLAFIKKYPKYEYPLDDYSVDDIAYIRCKNIEWDNVESIGSISGRYFKNKTCIMNADILFLNELCQWRGSLCNHTKYSKLPIFLEADICEHRVLCKQNVCSCISNDEIKKE